MRREFLRLTARSGFAVAEILAVLIAGNLAGGLTVQALAPALGIDPGAANFDPGQTSAEWLGNANIWALTLCARFGWLLLFAWLVMRFVHGFTLRRVGVGTGGRSAVELFGAGVLLYAVASLPSVLAHLFDFVVDIGDGLDGWQLFSQYEVTLGYLAYVLAAQVVLPPLFEEPLARGYMRVRIEKGCGPLAGVILAGVLFMAVHGHFYVADGLVLSRFAAAIYAAILWGWVTWRMNSVVPAIIAHALGNLPLPIEPPMMLGLAVVMSAVIAAGRRYVVAEARAFRDEFGSVDAGQLLIGLVLIAVLIGAIVINGALTPLIGVAALVAAVVSWLPPVRRWTGESSAAES